MTGRCRLVGLLTATAIVFAFMVASIQRAEAQLEITEIMFDSVAEEPKWEWIEIRNAGTIDVDLDGYVLDDASSSRALTSANIRAQISDEILADTVVPAGRVAVMYNGRNLDFTPTRFRAAWNLADTVPLIGVDGWQRLNNGGDAFGLWADFESYEFDLANIDEDDDLEVAQFDNSLTWIDFTVGFPSPTGASIEWNGQGDFRAAANWLANDESSSSTSVATTEDGQAINSVEDIGNPGVVIASGEPSSLVITELMYNPASDEPAWEWIEIFNGSGEAIDFAEQSHYLDDLAGDALSQPNLREGVIQDGAAAVLIRAGLDTDSMKAAWGDDINFIPVGSWPPLNNGGDLVGIWGDTADYLADSGQGQDRTDQNAITSVNYLDGNEDWPNVDNGTSISLLDLEGELDDPTNWTVSADGDGESFFAKAVIGFRGDHAGGDLGTPGAFGQVVDACSIPQDGLVGDLDGNGTVGFSDFLILSSNFSKAVSTYEEGDIDCDGSVAFADFLALADNFGNSMSQAAVAVPEPSTSIFVSVALIVLLSLVRGGRNRPLAS